LNVTGAVINAAPIVGAGNVTLNATGLDLIITVAMVRNVTINLTATRDIIVAALVQTTAATADINLTADSDHDHVGGVWIQSTGKVDSAANVTISGSNLYNPGAPNLTFTSIQVDVNGV